MKKSNKIVVSLLTVGLCTTLMAGTAFADPWKNESGKAKGWQKKQIKPQVQIQLNYSNKFKDVQSHWAKNDIEKLQQVGIMKGYENQMFMPQKPVTKNEAIAIISRVIDNNETSSEKDDLIKQIFPGWMGLAPVQAYDAGIIKDWELAAWNGNKPATRIEVAMWISRAAGDEEVSLEEILSYKDTNQLSKDELYYAALLNKKGIMRGTPDGYLNPFKPITRGEFAVMISRYIDNEDGSDTTEQTDQELLESLSPANKASIAVDTDEFTVRFSEDMVLADVKDLEDLPEAVEILKYEDGEWVDAELEYAIVFSEDSDRLVVKLDSNEVLANATKYCITVDDDILVTADEDEDDAKSFPGIDKGDWYFNTEAEDLALDEVNATNDTTIVLEFNQDIQEGAEFSSNGTGIHVMKGETELDIDAASINDNQLTITLDADDSLEDGEEYLVWISEDVIDDFTIDEADAEEFEYQD